MPERDPIHATAPHPWVAPERPTLAELAQLLANGLQALDQRLERIEAQIARLQAESLGPVPAEPASAEPGS